MATSPQTEMVKAIPAPDANGRAPEGDDWTSLTDPAERRRRQNRINQRAHRMRQRQRMRENKNLHPKRVVGSSSSSSSSSLSSSSSSSSSFSSSSSSSSQPSTAIIRKQSSSSSSDQSPRENGCFSDKVKRMLLNQFAASAFKSYTQGSPTSEHLLMLTQVNVYRAFGTIVQLLGWNFDDMDDDAISPFAIPTAARASTPPDYSNMPLSLRPTRIQRTTPHHPWLDFFPIPKMRDNMIQAGNDWDDEALCQDIMGFWANSSTAAPGLLVWGEPWDPRNWELTEAFLKKWQWIVRGCPEIMESTNAWRARRGEKLIFRYI